MKISIHYFFMLALFSMIASSCSTAKIATSELDQIKKQNPPDGKALVYILRPSGTGAIIKFKVTCDDKPVGSTNGKRFIYTFVDPGTHKFVAKAENKEEIFLTVEAGKSYFLEQKAKMGFFIARTDWERLDEAVGRKKLQSCKLSGNCPAFSMPGS